MLPFLLRECELLGQQPLELLARRLDSGPGLSPDDRAAVLNLPFKRRSVPPATYLAREGDPAASCAVLLSGYAYRHKLASTGARQIVSIDIPGEALDFQSLRLGTVDHNVQTMTHADLAIIPMDAIRELVDTRPGVSAAVMRNLLVEASLLREWVLNVGRRNARERLAHLLCEFAFRLDAQSLGSERGYALPMTQEQIGDALGLTSVHVNRSIRALEAEGLIHREGRTVSFPDTTRLRQVADFSELYLHA